ncbi:RraA family protein [Sphaerisporangium aureirubrum]|uniref:Putative 4-hydroxy-4-methyl-2-oxoglutarate aldolase n=1 Tax=Sphaerisporangium aureirubrum TaxID=1544736 RepID=A0ABW1NQ38_9ACTN
MVPPTTAIADVLQLRGQTGWLSPPLRRVHSPVGLIGRARTVLLAPGPGEDDLESLHAVLDDDLCDRVLVLAGARAAAGAVWGEIHTRAALSRHLTALVVEGGVRDLNAFRDLDLPAWALYEATAGPGPGVHVAAVGEPVDVAGVRVTEDTLIVMDTAGVIALPTPDVLDDSYVYAEAEEDVITALREGNSLTEAHRHKAQIIAKLRHSP